jgi:hypothetical protein
VEELPQPEKEDEDLAHRDMYLDTVSAVVAAAAAVVEVEALGSQVPAAQL